MFAPTARAKRLQWKIALMYLGIICAVQQLSICLLILFRIHSIYIINTYIPLMDRVNSMVMVEKLKRNLAEELHEAPQKQINIRTSQLRSVGTNKNQVESFLVILDSG
jgi:hypothetical protein